MFSIIVSTPSGSFKADRLYLFNLVLAHKVVKFLERIALEALLHPLPFSVTGLFGAFWRRSNTVFTSFYLWDLSFNSDGVHSLGPFVAAGERIG